MDPVIITTIATGTTCSLGAVIGARIYLPKLIVKNELRKMSEAERIEYAVKAELLENAEVVDLLAPVSEHQVAIDREGNKKPRQQSAWLSPFPEAVKAVNRRRKDEVKHGKKLTQARKQIAAAASKVTVEVMPENVQPANAGPEHFFITFKLQGSTEQKITALGPQIMAQLGLQSLQVGKAPDYRSVRFEAHTVEPVDRLVNEKRGLDFFEANPAVDLSSIPLAVAVDGTVWNYPMAHGLVLGMTGSGKGSPLHGLIRQLAPAVVDGRARLYGIDPKNIELKVFPKSSLFTRLVLGQTDERMNDAMALIEHVFDLMMARGESLEVDLENANLARSLDYTTETPLILLMIDEMLSLLIDLQDRGKEGKRAIRLLTTILAQGRSLGVIVIGATQKADMELLGRMRDNFANFIVLRQPSVHFNDLFLGDKAAARGFDSTMIAPANKANKYATAGVGYVKEETGNPIRVRFAYSSDRDIADLVIANRAKVASFVTTETSSSLTDLSEAGPKAWVPEQEDEWGFTEATNDDSDDDGFEQALPKL